MAILDWSIIVVVFVFLGAIAVYTKRYTIGVADFLSANRSAGRYLLGGAEMLAFMSATMFVARFEQYYQGGFPILWWSQILAVIALMKALFGWISYRYRETRAMTMAQFFEVRYSRKFRIFAGILAWSSGILNFLIHPAVTSRLIVYFCGLPDALEIGGVKIKTFVIVMAIMLSIAVTLTLAGGQIALMITDFLQAQMVLVVSLVVVFFLVTKFGWSDIVEPLKNATSGESMLNPLNQSKIPDFNIWFFVMMAFLAFYQEMAFQGNQGYFSAAKNPHEAKMARIFGIWRGIPVTLLCLVPPIIAYIVFNSQNYCADAEMIQGMLDKIPEAKIQEQMRVPLLLRHFLPVGLTGMLMASFIACSISTDDTYLHAWGSIFVQDILIPLKKKKLSPKEHLTWIRFSVVAVAIIALIGASILPIRDFILMYFQISFAIYAGGIGAAIIGGLYWNRGTTAGAWVATITGAILSGTGFILKSIWTDVPFFVNIIPEFPLNGVEITIIVSFISIALYVFVSLISNKKRFNMDKMLHRGKYSIEGEHVKIQDKIGIFRKLTGIDAEFTTKDKVVALIASAWILSWSFIVWGGSIYGMFIEISDDAWARWWFGVIVLFMIIGVVTFFWYFIGGMKDIADLFHKLKTVKRDEHDDGTVSNMESDSSL